MTGIYIQLLGKGWDLYRPQWSNFTLIAKYSESCYLVFAVSSGLYFTVATRNKYNWEAFRRIHYNKKIQPLNWTWEIKEFTLSSSSKIFSFFFFTIQPSWIMLLCSDWMMISQRTENGKVPSHEVSRCARVQLSICQRERIVRNKWPALKWLRPPWK